MKISSESMMAITKKPVRPSQGACRFALPCASSSPSEGEPGGRPKPRKSSEVSVVIEPLRMKGRKVSVATMAFGSRCLNMIVAFDRPERARGADVFEVAGAQELGAHHADQRHPGEQQQDAEQHEEARRDDRRDDDQEIERRDRGPDLDEALER